MSFIYLFDKIGFDKNGAVCATKACTLEQARSNFLYLLSKYNQHFLQEDKLPIPAFFKENLSGVLSGVENGENYESAKKEVLKNCTPKVITLAKGVKSEQEMISKLNDLVYVNDSKVGDLKKADNKKHLEYILTALSGNVFESVFAQINSGAEAEKKTRSNLYKDIIKYNSLVSTADKVKENKCAFEDVVRQAN